MASNAPHAAPQEAYTTSAAMATIKAEMVSGGMVRGTWTVSVPVDKVFAERDIVEIERTFRALEALITESMHRLLGSVPNEIEAKGLVIAGRPIERA